MRTRILAALAVALLAAPAWAQITYTPRPDPAQLKQESSSSLAVRDGGTASVLAPQDVTVYLFCDPEPTCTTGYARARIGWTLNNAFLTVAFESAGTGTARTLKLGQGFSGTQFASTPVPSVATGQHLGSTVLPWGTLYNSYGAQGGFPKTLTDAAAAAAYLRIAVPTNGQVSGEVLWDATSVSGSDRLIANGSVRWWGAATASTPVCGINKIGTDGEGHSGGANTLVCTWTNVVNGTNCDISVTCTNDLASTQAITLTGRPTMARVTTISFP